MRRITMVVVAIVVLAAGCASEAAPNESAGCGTPAVEPGDYRAVNDHGDAGQVYWTIVPETYDGSPVPVHMILASGGGDPDTNHAAWRPAVEGSEGLVVVVDTRPVDGRREPATFDALVDGLGRDYCIDLDRVHLSGSSWSGQLAATLMCERPETFASFADGLAWFRVYGCDPVPKPLVAWTGDDDRFAVAESVEYWAEANGCDPTPVAADLGSGITAYTYESCEADVVFYDFDGMGHKVPSKECTGPGAVVCEEYADFDLIETMNEFFAAHPLR